MNSWNGQEGSPEEEKMAGQTPYLDFLGILHKRLQPRFYFEIGVRHGRSLALARCPALGVDPLPDLATPLPSSAQVVAATSDAYFADTKRPPRFDLAFIDGLHQFEQALRDFINLERCARPGAVIIIDDILPNHPKQASRVRQTRVWTGDVWKLAQALQRYRPDLFLVSFDTHPTGTLLVAGLDPANTTLIDRYDEIVAAFEHGEAPSSHILHRFSARPCEGDEFNGLLEGLAHRIGEDEAPPLTVSRLRPLLRPKLSVILLSYNMAREIGRTIRSFSTAMQRGIETSDYELILIDNGSTKPFNENEIARLAGNLSIYSMPNATPSPVRAINWGLEMARAPLVGVCIDGARMASPGLLAAALRAQHLHPRPVIGSLAFHLGPDVQMRSVLEGYNQQQEDELLARSGWEQDGYRLFDIAVFAGSSAAGWFVVPAETNALFMTADQWRQLGGYDPAFEMPGGGLANLDIWKRVSTDPSALTIMLLGEGTFHQVHGGVATNAVISPKQAFAQEYLAIRGEPYAPPQTRAIYVGSVHTRMSASLAASLAKLQPPA
jgi:hypothetical protein